MRTRLVDIPLRRALCARVSGHGGAVSSYIYGGMYRVNQKRTFLAPIVDQVVNDDDDDKNKGKDTKWQAFFEKCAETVGITFSSIAILGVMGYLYHKFYDYQVLQRMSQAFENGNTESTMGNHYNDSSDPNWVQRPQQGLVDRIIAGELTGRYFLIFGEKGTGKTSLILESIKRSGGSNVIMFDAHEDPEIVRIRLGRAINFSYNEDYIGSLFSMRGPRDTTALLDIERAFNKLEELSLKNKATGRKPLVMIINHSHLIKENEEGVKLLELLQQKAESLSGSGLLTMIFNSDDYWVYEKLKRLGTRLELINVRDFRRLETVRALKYIRNTNGGKDISTEECNVVYNLIGGRPQHIAQVALHSNIVKACNEIIDREKTWFLNQCGLLGMDMDDDVMELGKFSTSAMKLMREFVEMDRGSGSILGGGDPARNEDHRLPELPLWRSRQIMTRADYIQQYDNLNIFTLDAESRVRADSVPMMRAFHEIALQPHFDELLDDTVQRVADIESLGRTREVVMKDLMLGSKYRIRPSGDGTEVVMEKSKKEVDLHGDYDLFNGTHDHDEDDDDDLYLENVGRHETRRLWKTRLGMFKKERETEKGNE